MPPSISLTHTTMLLLQVIDFSILYVAGYFSQEYQFDFYNYAGIHRPVILYTTPRVYVEDITLRTDVSFSGESPVGIVLYDVAYDGTLESDDVRATIHIIDDNGTIISEGNELDCLTKLVSSNNRRRPFCCN